MDTTLPKSQIILSYREFFNEEPPANPLDLIKDFCKTTILGEFAALNYFLKPKTTMYYDTSLKTQWKLLFQFSGSIEDLFKALASKYQSHIVSDYEYPIIFSREGCLFAFEQIVQSDMKEIPGFTMAHSWPNFFRYIMAINTEITRRTNYETVEARSLEELNPQMLPLNELSINVNPLYTPYRGHRMMEYLTAHPQLGEYFKNYFESTYHIPFGHFVYELLSMYYANNKEGENNITNPITGEKLDVSFFYSVKPADQAMFLALSYIFPNEKVERLISIKKFPFYNAGQNQFLLLDSVILMDKAYGQFINDFWFDSIKSAKNEAGKPLFDIKYYRSAIGLFVEGYVNKILRFCFKNNKNQVLKTLDELIIKTGKGHIELTDIYLRYKKQILIAEIKSTGLYDEEKYSGDINQMYKNDREAFFSSFGVDQVVNCISNLKASIKAIDPEFPDKRCHIFPAIIVNEKAMQTPFMADIFNTRFNELMKEVHTDNLVIYPLSLIHVSDLEHIEDHMHRQPQELWNLLRYHLRFPKFIPPFYNSVLRKDIRISFSHVKDLFGELILKYQRVKK